MDINKKLADELAIKDSQVTQTISLLDEGATVPFIARYRKEVTGGLSDTTLRQLEERLVYLRDVVDRQQTIIDSIEKQGKLTPTLKQQILETDNKAKLEDLYTPYKQKRRTKGQIAKEAGLEPLAQQLLADPNQDPDTLAAGFLNTEKQINTAADALQGARAIIMEQIAEQPELVGSLRDFLADKAEIASEVVPEKQAEAIKFQDYFDHHELIKDIPSHRALALLRGRREGFLRLSLRLEDADRDIALQRIADTMNWQHQGRAADDWLQQTVLWIWKIKLMTKLELDLVSQMREQAETAAIDVFANNLKHLLMAAPAGHRNTLALDPGLRTGVKVAALDATGKYLEHATIFPHAPRNQWDQSLHVLAALCKKHHIELISIGNGTASRETERLVNDLQKQHKDLKVDKIVVSEAGASVYSASELAANEFPDLDVSFRGAVSIGRRLQDPLAELVKIEPKAIGVGQYQHDVNQLQLTRTLSTVVEDCVNAVGVDLNSASAPLLAHISGLNKTLANNIVAYREANGAFKTRDDLKKVTRFGDKAFEQAAGFLRISKGDNPLDASGVHPESYAVVEKILAKTSMKLQDLMGKQEVTRKLQAQEFVDDQFGLPTVQDIISELEKPGRDPRPEFVTVKFKDGVEKPEDLKEGMVLEGMVTNVANFGAFVDIGVHQDGLVHTSQLANHYVKDPNDVVKVGDIVQVKVLDVDLKRQRISLTMKLNEQHQPRQHHGKQQRSQRGGGRQQKAAPSNTLLSDALKSAFKK